MAQIEKENTTDEVVRETRRIKEALAKDMDFDVDRILEAARSKQQESGREILAPPARQVA